MKASLKFFFLSFFLLFFFCSCFSVGTNFLSGTVLGYTNEEQKESMKTLDPEASYSQRAGIMMKLMGDEEKLEELQKKFPNLVSSVLRSSRENVKELEIETQDKSKIKAFLVYPESHKHNRVKDKKYPVILFSHGGGFTAQDFTVYEKLTGKIANNTESVILFYEYRLAPEFKFPTQVNDLLDTYTWLCDNNNAKEYELDNTDIILFGDSSGGNLAEGLCIRLSENGDFSRIKGVVLAYPSLDVSDRLNYSRIAFSGAEDPNRYYVTSLNYLAFVMNSYLEKKEDAYKPYASPLIMMEGLLEVKDYVNESSKYKANLTLPLDYYPEHLIIVPEIDTLRDEGKAYNALLRAYGAKSTLKVYKGMFHGFLMCYDFINAANNALLDVCSFSNKIFDLKRNSTPKYHEKETLVISTVPSE